MQLINITSVPAESVNANEMQIIARWKNTDSKPIEAKNRARAVILPANLWSKELSNENKQLEVFLHDAVSDLAKDYLQTICNESNMARTQVPLESFALDKLLAWNAERAAISGRLNGADIAAWAAQSATVRNITAAHGDAVAKALTAQFVKLASPNHGLKPEKADKLLSTLFAVEDADNNVGLRVMMRLQNIRDRVENTEANILDSIL